MLQMEAKLTRIKSTWKQNHRFVRDDFDHLFASYNHCLNSHLTSVFLLQEYKPIGTGHNRKAQPFVAAANIDDKRQVVSASYNTPIGLYSSGNIQDAMEGQIRGLVHPKPAR